ncbi:PREDICTED: uncharacterized protein LOC109154699 [Ipomoea nil]|uniref:uncharacterized protein LOC109154699 n=1 Tax=Ipomoea nil TaxID=35883 RepID=UPI00090192F1|nr:PREDICTED: uncharacterized protein LOC109154699 [Ipomoea nil]
MSSPASVMVLEPQRGSYAAVVTDSGESSQGTHPASPINRSPTRPSPMNNPQRNNDTENIENLLFLSANESLNTILVSPPLSGTANYGTWSISMRVALEVKNKWTIVDGSYEAPDRAQPQFAAWRRCNLIICAWILKSVHSSIAQSLMYIDKAEQMWNDMRKRFSQRDPHRISSLQNEIYSLKQGLNEGYNSLKSSVLVLDPLPDMHKIFVMAEKFERQLNIANMNLTGIELNHANVVQTNQFALEDVVAAVNQYNNRKNFSNGGGNKSAKCTFLRMTDHTIEKCYKKHGYPPGWVPGYKSKGKQQAIAATASQEASITHEQLQKLMSMLQNQMGNNLPSPTTAAVTLIPKFNEAESQKEGKYYPTTHINSVSLHSFSWILDSGATDHIACSLDSFDDYYVVEGTMVNLPNGKHIRVEHMGNITLGDGICLRNVLHIPSFKFNIISVSKLLNNSPHLLTFTNDQCLLRGSHGRTVGFAKEENGLYLLLEPPQITVNSCKLSILPKLGTKGLDIFP